MATSRRTHRTTVIENVTTILGERHREIALLGVLLGCTFAMVSLIGYDATDPTLLHPGAGEVANPCGPLGALLADLLFALLGHGAWLVFGGMVLAVLALAGRRVIHPVKMLVGSGLYLAVLAVLHLLLRPGEPYPPGGVVGAFTAEALEGVLGTVGAWLALLGALLATLSGLLRIRWTRIFGAAVDRAELWLPRAGAVLKRGLGAGNRAVAGGARWMLSQVVAVARGGLRRTGRTARRMARSLVRHEGDTSPDEDWSSELEEMGGDPDSFTPESGVEPTQVGGPVALAEVEWVPTEEAEASSEVLGMFPELAPRRTTTGAGSRVSEVREVDEDTSPSEAASPAASAATPSAAEVRAPAPDVPAKAVAVVPATREAGPGAQVHKSAYLDKQVRDDGGAVSRPSGVFQLPRLSMLDVVPPQRAEFDSDELRELAHTVEETLGSFKVAGEVTDVRVGPVVTTFEFLPEKGISVRKVASLEDDLAMGLCALSVRIVAPIPGKGVVGIEIPSSQRLTIYLRELLASDEFRKTKAALPVVLGKDVEGAPVVEDLAKMPHLLVGGTTGSGKSVGVNGMLMSLLFTRTPDELRLLLVDPKKLEFSMYEDIPHLLHPVVTEPKKAAAALAWACREMDERYELLARWDTRNIAGYNRKVEREVKDWTPEKARRYAPPDWPGGKPFLPEKLPYIVIVIDELADLMLVAKKEVEGSIARLTQMARACGIHLIVATQRPSVDVVTGLIKSNLPSRISFKLRSGTDSRTILDATGAETLLGRGDMLYLPNAGDIIRCHGAFASDEEAARVVDFLRDQAEPQYIDAVTQEPGSGEEFSDEDLDSMYEDAVQVVVSAGKASTSMIQRHLKIGYNRAARIIDQMESRGVVGPADGARPREVLVGDPCP